MREIRGARIGSSKDDDLTGERGILAAVILNALRAAERGDYCAITWLDQHACRLLELIGIEVRDWRQAASVLQGPRLRKRPGAAQRERVSPAERSRIYRQRRKNARVGTQEGADGAQANG